MAVAAPSTSRASRSQVKDPANPPATVARPARFRVIAILACVLALDSADKGTVGAAGPELS